MSAGDSIPNCYSKNIPKVDRKIIICGGCGGLGTKLQYSGDRHRYEEVSCKMCDGTGRIRQIISTYYERI